MTIEVRRPIAPSVVEQFRKIDVACISDVLHGLRLSCIYQGLKPLVREWKLCGPALTIRLIPLQDPGNWFKEEHHPATLMDLSQPGDVVVIDQGGRIDVAIWGGNTATRAKRIKLGGVVIDGATRDGEGVIEAGVPTFVRSTTPLHGHGTFRSTCYMSEPVQLGPAAVAPGDLVIGDSDGIVVIPASRAIEIVKLAQERHDIDEMGLTQGPVDEQERRRRRAKVVALQGLAPAPNH
jgi:4-hydroxy-4-methyl-2-oxoglutarate aldolase